MLAGLGTIRGSSPSSSCCHSRHEPRPTMSQRQTPKDHGKWMGGSSSSIFTVRRVSDHRNREPSCCCFFLCCLSRSGVVIGPFRQPTGTVVAGSGKLHFSARKHCVVHFQESTTGSLLAADDSCNDRLQFILRKPPARYRLLLWRSCPSSRGTDQLVKGLELLKAYVTVIQLGRSNLQHEPQKDSSPSFNKLHRRRPIQAQSCTSDH
jgi:hypothetical protein